MILTVDIKYIFAQIVHVCVVMCVGEKEKLQFPTTTTTTIISGDGNINKNVAFG